MIATLCHPAEDSDSAVARQRRARRRPSHRFTSNCPTLELRGGRTLFDHHHVFQPPAFALSRPVSEHHHVSNLFQSVFVLHPTR